MSPNLGSDSSLYLPEPVLFDYFSFPIGKFACGDEGGIFVLLGSYILGQGFVIKILRKVWLAKPHFIKCCLFFQRSLVVLEL